jgi:hypothetical protein
MVYVYAYAHFLDAAGTTLQVGRGANFMFTCRKHHFCAVNERYDVLQDQTVYRRRIIPTASLFLCLRPGQ